MHTPLPYHLYIWVNNKHLGPEMPNGLTAGILHGVYAKNGQMMLTHVQLESGAHWSGLPLHVLTHKEITVDLPQVEPWGCMGREITATHFPYLDGQKGKTLKEGYLFRHTGIIIDWNDGYSRYPQEHKPLSLVALEQGNFGLLPNNYFKIQDKHFTEDLDSQNINLKKYKRGDQIYWEK
jgi:hypothetical protein